MEKINTGNFEWFFIRFLESLGVDMTDLKNCISASEFTKNLNISHIKIFPGDEFYRDYRGMDNVKVIYDENGIEECIVFYTISPNVISGVLSADFLKKFEAQNQSVLTLDIEN